VEVLLGHGFEVFSINHKQLDCFRDRYFPAGAQDDGRDALVLANSLRTDQHCFRALHLSDPRIIRLRELTRVDEELKLLFPAPLRAATPATSTPFSACAGTPEALDAWVAQLRQRFGSRSIAVALEQSRGALLFTLSKYANLALYPIHPGTTSCFRQGMYPSGSKSDPLEPTFSLICW
jgi:hypothetical protein